jgi:general secretion pathway protein K
MRTISSPPARRAFVLIVVLGMVMTLTVILMGFNGHARSSLKIADALRKSHQAVNCAHAGLNVAIAAIGQTTRPMESVSMRPFLCGDKTLPLEQGACTIELTTENGKLNLNKLSDASGGLDRTRIDQVLRLIDLLNRETKSDERISYSIVPALIDWTDNDDEITHLPFIAKENAGAESAYYRGLGQTLTPQNRALDSCEEILQIRGISPSVYQRLQDHITVKGDGKIDINSASKLILQCFSPEIDPALAQIIVNRREIKPYTNLQELKDLPAMTSSIFGALSRSATVAPSDLYYRVQLVGDVDGVQCRIGALLRKNPSTRMVDVTRYVEM